MGILRGKEGGSADHHVLSIQVSRLQNGADVSREVYSAAKEDLKYPIENYMLYWPERKVSGIMPYACSRIHPAYHNGPIVPRSCI